MRVDRCLESPRVLAHGLWLRRRPPQTYATCPSSATLTIRPFFLILILILILIIITTTIITTIIIIVVVVVVVAGPEPGRVCGRAGRGEACGRAGAPAAMGGDDARLLAPAPPPSRSRAAMARRCLRCS
jgi:hypothetical protein